jgi:hypothetical protein
MEEGDWAMARKGRDLREKKNCVGRITGEYWKMGGEACGGDDT